MVEPDFLKELNDEQRKAVEYIDGPSLVIAGAGSGKTRVLTYKIAYLLQQGLQPWNILALTFTNKAAREMKERIAQLIGGEVSSELWMGTFHSLFARILRREASLIGFTSNFTIYQPSDSRSLVKSIIKEMELDEKIYKPQTVCNRISEAKNALILPEEYVGDQETYQRDRKSEIPEVGNIYIRYTNRLLKANAMDFDDLLLYTFLLLDRQPDIRRKYANRFQFILVDEYQDTNFAQHQIMHLLAEEGRERICVVGDDAQSIYSFRGARIDNILKFTSQYHNAQLFKLQRNYRSTQTIVEAANSLIACNKRQIPKEVFSKNEVGKPLILNVAYSDVEEGEIVCNRIQKIHAKEQIPYQEMAVLYRTNAQSRIFEEGLRKRMIPYRIYGGRSFYDQKIIRDVLAYFRLAMNPDDEEALKRIINFPTRGIGGVTLGKLVDAAAKNGVGVWAVLTTPQQYGVDISSSALKKVEAFSLMIKDFIQISSEQDAYSAGNEIIKKSGLLEEVYKDRDAESREMQENLSELLNGMNTFVQFQKEIGQEKAIYLSDYLSEVSLLSDTDDKETENQDRITLMTVHSAKGLEFDTVFIVGMEENLFPNVMALGSQRELEEERRLFYVALTRAKRQCFLSCSKSRFQYGKMEFCNPSSFLRDINREYIRMEVPKTSIPKTQEKSRPSIFNERPVSFIPRPHPRRLKPIVSNKEVVTDGEKRDFARMGDLLLKVGQTIEHERFGLGHLVSLEGPDGNVAAMIKFENSGTKRLLLKYAKIKIVG